MCVCITSFLFFPQTLDETSVCMANRGREKKTVHYYIHPTRNTPSTNTAMISDYASSLAAAAAKKYFVSALKPNSSVASTAHLLVAARLDRAINRAEVWESIERSWINKKVRPRHLASCHDCCFHHPTPYARYLQDRKPK